MPAVACIVVRTVVSPPALPPLGNEACGQSDYWRAAEDLVLVGWRCSCPPDGATSHCDRSTNTLPS